VRAGAGAGAGAERDLHPSSRADERAAHRSVGSPCGSVLGARLVTRQPDQKLMVGKIRGLELMAPSTTTDGVHFGLVEKK